MRVLIGSYYVPHIDRDSGSRRIWDIIGFLLDAGWQVHFHASNGLGDVRHAGMLDRVQTGKSYELTCRQSDTRYARMLQQRGVVVHDGLNTPIGEVLTTFSFDLAMFGFWTIAELHMPVVRAVSPATRVIVDSLDLHFVRDARRVLRGTGVGEKAKLLGDDYAQQMRGELNTYAAADSVLAVSSKETDLINDLLGDSALASWVPDCEALAPSTLPFADRRGILCVGSYQHAPNVEAVAWLCREALPLVPRALLKQHPLYIVGSGLNDTVRNCARDLRDARLVGWVPSVAEYFERMRISVVPLLHGAGTKRKLIQALSTGTPTVSTSIGTEGLNLRDGQEALVADDPAAFAEAIERLLTDEPLWQSIRENGRAHIVRTHSAEAARQRLIAAVDATMQKTPKAPLLPAITIQDHWRRANYEYHHQLAPHIRDAVDSVLPPGSTVVVVSEGIGEFLHLGTHHAWHFLQDESGSYAHGHPADSDDAILRLEALRAQGGEFLLFPAIAFWWLDRYVGLRMHLEARYRKLVERQDACILYSLRDDTIPSLAQSNGTNRDAHVLHEPRVLARDWAHDVHERGGARLIAFYLPQFHPIEENNAWWGDGFTEWTNVVKAQPLFDEHLQPQLPADLGFYDLRAPETRHAQAELARAHGIHGFCYYHYWFGGKRLLERPFGEVLASGDPDFPFCLCWANEPWSRRWDGRAHDVLQDQKYSAKDDLAHIHSLIPALSDPRAIQIDGRSLFIVYQGRELPDAARTIELWRREVERAGLPGIYLMAVETGWDAGWDATQEGFDAKVLFQPQFSILRTTPRTHIDGMEKLQVYDYAKAWPVLSNPDPVGYRRYDTVFPTWDNTPRQGENGTVVHNSTPAEYRQWLAQAIARTQDFPADQRVVFINAWNEWGEGAHLEPDMKNGRAYLEATRETLIASAKRKAPTRRKTKRRATSGAEHE